MSRYSLKPLPGCPELFEVAVGWDAGLSTFFVVVFGGTIQANETAIRLWRGTSFCDIPSTDMLLSIAREFAEIPDGLALKLDIDRLITPHDPEAEISMLMTQLLTRFSSRGG